PDLQFSVEEQVAEGDCVVTAWTATGTHLGDLLGMAPTGHHVTVSGMYYTRIAHGRIVEGRLTWDTLGMMQQLGAIPSEPGEPGERIVTNAMTRSLEVAHSRANTRIATRTDESAHQANKGLVRGLFDRIFNGREYDRAGEFFAARYTVRDSSTERA